MKNENHNHQQRLQVQEVHSKVIWQSPRKVDEDTPHVVYQPKSSLCIGQPRTRFLHFQRQEDKSLICTVCGRKIPATRQGELDKKQLAYEILFREFPCLDH